MKKFLLLLLLFPVIANAAPSAAVIASLKPFQPKLTTLKDGQLTIVLPQKQITNEIYTTVISTAVCSSLWLRSEQSLDGVKSVYVLNEFAHQGYVFEGGKELCIKYGKLPQSENKIFLLSNTHLK